MRVKSEKGGWEDGNEVFVQKKQNPTSSEVGSVLLQLTIIVYAQRAETKLLKI